MNRDEIMPLSDYVQEALLQLQMVVDGIQAADRRGALRCELERAQDIEDKARDIMCKLRNLKTDIGGLAALAN